MLFHHSWLSFRLLAGPSWCKFTWNNSTCDTLWPVWFLSDAFRLEERTCYFLVTYGNRPFCLCHKCMPRLLGWQNYHWKDICWASSNLLKVLTRLCEAGLRLKPRKCFFAMQEVVYLGYCIFRDDIRADPAKVQTVQDFPWPKDLRERRSFLGLTSYYRRFIPLFSKAATPLYAVTKEDVPLSGRTAVKRLLTGWKRPWPKLQSSLFPIFPVTFVWRQMHPDLGLVLSYLKSELTRKYDQ